MKTAGTNYLNGNVQKRVIQCYARQIATRFRPDKIILFGSHAYGKPHPQSGVDLLVIMPARNQLDQAVKIRWTLSAPFPMDLLVRTPKNLKMWFDDGNLFLTEIVTRGKVLYEKKHRRLGAKGGKRLRERAAAESRKGLQ